MESNRKFKPCFGSMIKVGNKIFKKYFLLFNLVILIYIGLILYFGNYNINKLLDFDRIIINTMFWGTYMFILWIGCLLSYITNIVNNLAINIMYKDKEESSSFKIIVFTVTFILMEFLMMYTMNIQNLESKHMFYLYSMANFIGCYFGIVKNIK
ncbi:hypothetical protein [Clostridium sp. Ade.TY]|uniref:hypothetical protein n=1 Tax=Clostridium sp. Ade.TY TaxID=1391647 RepID=UPI0004299499|nr:hypothetical protein [Clostridium sp. Ade.TY]